MASGLARIRVLEIAGGVGVAYAAKLFADLGADVIRLEPLEGSEAHDVVRQRPHQVATWLNTNKRSIVGALNYAQPGFADSNQSNHSNNPGTANNAGAGTYGDDATSQLIDTAQILLHDLGPDTASAAGLSFEELSSRNLSLVVCAITPFGSTGPYANFVGEELNVIHGSSWGFLSPSASTRIDLPPLKAPGHHATINAATTAATTALAAFDAAQRNGRGALVDFSLFAAAAKMTETAPISASYHNVDASRLGVKIVIPWNIYRCRDGLVQFICPEEPQWRAFVSLMGTPVWTTLEPFSTALGRRENADLIDIYLGEWMAEQTVDDLFRRAQAARICITPMHTMAQLDVDPHFAARGFFATTPDGLRLPGPGFQTDQQWWGLRRSAPSRGQHNGETWLTTNTEPVQSAPTEQSVQTEQQEPGEQPGFAESSSTTPTSTTQTLTKPTSTTQTVTTPTAMRPAPSPALAPREGADDSRPLAGIRVCDFSWIWAGPYCTQTLAHLGADVIKLESVDRLCMFRRLPYAPKGVELTHDTAGVFHLYNTDKRSVGIDLRKAESRAIIEKLVAVSDVVVDNFGVGTMVRLGLGPEELRKINPNVIVVSLSGYGQNGPASSYMAYGPAGGAFAGLYAANGYPGGFPAETGIAIGDPGTGIAGAWAIMAALAARRRNGEVATIDGAMVEAVAATIGEPWMEWQSTGELPGPRGNRDPLWSPHGCYPASGKDRWVTIACTSEADWENLCARIDSDVDNTGVSASGVSDSRLSSDPRFSTAADRKRHEDALDERIAAWTVKHDRWDMTRQLQQLGVAAFPSLSPVDLWGGDPQLAAIGMLETPNHKAVGQRTIPGIPWLVSNTPNGIRLPAPLLGEHSAEVLTQVLGYSEAEVRSLVDRGVITEP
jgi:crotonobetainyl-CoA:carnitine CoA-transferase CaiB-like acyl-CoA transferase